MQQKVSFKLLPRETEDTQAIYRMIAETSGKKPGDVTGTIFLKSRLMRGVKQYGYNSQ